ncbi:MAG: phosphoribosyltransferase [Bacteroidales bacterium]|nr:phosphoribosyltransferase [Bacteroidales bacterium]
MSTAFRSASLRYVGAQQDASIYQLSAPQLSNKYFIISGEGTRRLMAFPEVIGFDSYLAMLPETIAALRYLFPSGSEGDVDILTILRGGLNYPIEEACHRVGIRVRDMHFISCERRIEEHIITGLDIKYEKLRITKDRTLVIGDIIATGDTLRMCLDQVVDRFRRKGGSIRKIIFFTIGGTRAIPLMERMNEQISAWFPDFEGFQCFFYEGIFSVYRDKGVSGINVPDIDFGWGGGTVSPEFRRYVMDRPDSLFEKCIIYDGGARRYEIPVHFEEVFEYWNGILERADSIDMKALVAEKLGYEGPLDYESWLQVTGLADLPREGLSQLWEMEQDLCRKASSLSLKDIAKRRITELTKISPNYE